MASEYSLRPKRRKREWLPFSYLAIDRLGKSYLSGAFMKQFTHRPRTIQIELVETTHQLRFKVGEDYDRLISGTGFYTPAVFVRAVLDHWTELSDDKRSLFRLRLHVEQHEDGWWYTTTPLKQ